MSQSAATDPKWRAKVIDVIETDPDRVARTYSRLSPVYEVWATLTEQKARKRVLELLRMKDGDDVLEVAVGTGAQLAQLASRNPSGTVKGVDLSTGMLSKARARLDGKGLGRVELEHASAVDLPFADESFDLLVNGYMLDLIPTDGIPEVLREFKRVLRPGGRIVLSNMTIGTTLPYRLWQALYKRGVNLTANCRGVLAAPVLDELGFEDVSREAVAQLGFPTEIVTARKQAPRSEGA